MGNSSPRILIAAGIYPPDPGGPAMHAKRQFEFFKEKGLQTEVVALAFYRHWPRVVRHLFFALALFKKALSADIISAHDAWGAGFPAFVIARVLGLKFVLRVGGDMAWERAADSNRTALSMNEWYEAGQQKKDLFYKLTKIVLPRVDALIVPTQLLVDLYHIYYKVPLEKIHLVPNPIPAKQNSTAQIPKKKIIYASRLVAYKNLEFVITSLKNVFAHYSDVTFEIMGEGPERSKLEVLVKNVQLEKKVIFLGKVAQTEVVQATEECLLGLAPALTEFNPNYILQCIAFGKPFLMSRENGLPFTVPEIFLFDARNVQEFEAKLAHLLTPEGYAEGIHAVQNIQFSMSWDQVLGKNLEIITSLLKA